MTNFAQKSESSIGNHRTNIRMSKLARAVQAATANTNWSEMARTLFRADKNDGRREQISRFFTEQKKAANGGESYNTEQLQYVLMLMLILTTAEKRTQEMYQQSFARRCDAISSEHDLKEDQYWADGNVPAEWRKLDAEFEQRSLQILLDTLREYHLDEIADLVETKGQEQLFDIIGNIESQFLKVLKYPSSGILQASQGDSGSIPETLQASSPQKGANESQSVPVNQALPRA